MKTPKSILLTLLFAVLGGQIARAAEFKLASVFCDRAVLQRDAPVPVWGWAEAGAEVAVEFAGQKKTASAGDDKKWLPASPFRTDDWKSL